MLHKDKISRKEKVEFKLPSGVVLQVKYPSRDLIPTFTYFVYKCSFNVLLSYTLDVGTQLERDLPGNITREHS